MYPPPQVTLHSLQEELYVHDEDEEGEEEDSPGREEREKRILDASCV